MNRLVYPPDIPDWEKLARAAEIPYARRIFVNRNLRMSAIEAIGFDMDHTLALYAAGPFEELAFEQAKKKLLEGGYPREVGRLRYNASFVIRGLVVDMRRGNIIKMDQHRYVARATHGTTPLSAPVRKRIYRKRLVRLSAKAYVPVDSPFSLPEIDLYAQLVDLLDRRTGWKQDYRILYRDVRGAIDRAHADGSIKDTIARHPERYILPDADLPATLDRFKRHGFKLFLLTNSEAPHTARVMARLLDGRIESRNRWTEFFDLIFVRAGKPDFFLSQSTPRSVKLPGVRASVEKAKGYTGGGVGGLERLLGCSGDRILFLGDHTYGDILRSKRSCLWRTAMVIQELEGELVTLERLAEPLRQLRRQRARRSRVVRVRDYIAGLAEGRPQGDGRAPTPKRTGRLLVPLDGEIARIDRRIETLEARCDAEHNPHWGSAFRTDHEPSIFAAQVGAFACVYCGRVSNFLNYPLDKYFRGRSEMMPHER